MIYVIAGAVLYLLAFWYVYVLVMGLYRAHLSKRLNKFTYALSAPALLIGLVMDVIANATYAWVKFKEPPKEWLVTTRLKRYINSGHGWRYRQAKLLCEHLLDPFDPTGKHC